MRLHRCPARRGVDLAGRLWGCHGRRSGRGGFSAEAALPASAIACNRALVLDRDGARSAVAAYHGACVMQLFLNGTAPEIPGIGEVRGWQKFARTLDTPLPEIRTAFPSAR
jgi:hypothetical protein